MNLKQKIKAKKFTKLDIFVSIVMTILVILIVIPFWNAIVISFTTNEFYINHRFALWPGDFTLSNYKALFERGNGLIVSYGNTIWVSVVGTVSGMVVMTLAAYAFSRRFPGRRILFMISIFSMYFGGGLVPTYLNLKNLNLLNTRTGIIMLTLVSVSHIIIIMKGFEAIPKELEEAAVIDGANDMQVFLKVMLPLNKPTLATYSLFTFVDLWNGWYWPMLIVTDTKKTMLQVYLRNIVNTASKMSSMAESSGTSAFSMGVQMACILVVIVPVMLIYPYVQKYFVKGIYVGSVKM